MEVMAKVDEMVPDTDRNQMMVAESAKENILPSNAQHGAKSAENVDRKTTSRISGDLTDPRVGTTIGSRVMTKAHTNATDHRTNKRLHEVDRNDGFDDWYGAADNHECR